MSRKNKHKRNLMVNTSTEIQNEVEEITPSPDAIDFDGWWALRSTKIPSQHHKEVIKADFRGRGLTTMETMEDFDEALKEYGIKL